MRLILFDMGALFGFSFVLHVFFLGIIRLGVLGINLKLCLNNLLNKYINLIPICSSIVWGCPMVMIIIFILLNFYLSLNVIFLDDKEVIVTASLENASFVMSGDA